ncbi:hypothetical protein G6F63_016257 [Rhizopus arrhizus]|nr:hypothetical protein G6F63_016257 [Rhizopus arrhizus]
MRRADLSTKSFRELSQEVGALLHRLLGLTAKAQVAQAGAAADQLLVEPGGPDHAGLPLDGQVRFQLHGYAAQALRVSTTAGDVGARKISACFSSRVRYRS